MTDNEILETLHANLVSGEDLKATLAFLLELSTFTDDPWLRDCLLRHKPFKPRWIRTRDETTLKGISRLLDVAKGVFESEITGSSDVRAKITVNESRSPRIVDFVVFLAEQLGLPDEADVFSARRPNRVERAAQGIEMGATQYNRKFRIVRGLHRELEKLNKIQNMRRRQSSGLVGLLDGIELDEFKRDPVAASIAAILAASKVEFYSESGVRPFAPLGPALSNTLDTLLDRCGAGTNWLLIARVLPESRVIDNLTDSECGELLGHWVNELTAIAQDMHDLWHPELLASDTLIVGEGFDFYTWNLLTVAWNDARSAWLKFLSTAGLGVIVDELYPSKSLRVFSPGMMRTHTKEELNLWKAMPRPWECMDGSVPCNKVLLQDACKQLDLPPVLSGWLTSNPIEASRIITPEFSEGYSRVATRHLSFGSLRG